MHKSPTEFAARHRYAYLALISLGLGACTADTATEIGTGFPESPVSLRCGESGFLEARLYGEIEATLEWSREDLECTGMPRPDGAGARLRFAGMEPDGGRRLAFIVAIPDLDRAAAGKELRGGVTLIEEGAGRFFSTAGPGNCVIDVSAMTALDDSDQRQAVSGALYCVSPLAEVNGTSSVSIPELRFSGLIDWSSS